MGGAYGSGLYSQRPNKNLKLPSDPLEVIFVGVHPTVCSNLLYKMGQDFLEI